MEQPESTSEKSSRGVVACDTDAEPDAKEMMHPGRGLEQGLTLTSSNCPWSKDARRSIHPDQRVQCAARAYVDESRSRELEISMAIVGEPEEDGYSERLMRSIKEEDVDRSEGEDSSDAWEGLGSSRHEAHSRKRSHSPSGYLTPAEFQRQ